MTIRNTTIRATTTLALLVTPALAQLQVTHITLEPGARLTSATSDLSMTVILGEPDAATTTGGALTLHSGFLPLVAPPVCPGDATGDQMVDFNDLNLLLAQWGASVTPGAGPDLDGDGHITFTDLNLLLGQWGADCA